MAVLIPGIRESSTLLRPLRLLRVVRIVRLLRDLRVLRGALDERELELAQGPASDDAHKAR